MKSKLRQTGLLITFLFFGFTVGFSQVSFTMNPGSGCAPLTVTFTNTSTVGDTYYWYIGNQQYCQGFDTSYTFAHPGYYRITLFAFANQQPVGKFEKDINVSGVDTFFVYPNTTVCPGEEMYFGVNAIYDNIKWYFTPDDSATFNWVPFSFDNPGTYPVMMIAQTNCGIDTVIQTVHITGSAIPQVAIQIPSNEYCIGDPIQFKDPFPSESYYWDFDDGGSSDEKDPIYTYSTNGFRNVTLTVINICNNTNSATTFIDINNNVQAQADFWNDDPVCPNNLVKFDAEGAGTHFWDFGDGSTSTLHSPGYVYTDTGAYTVRHIVVNGCNNSDTVEKVIHILYNPSQKPSAWIYFNNINSNSDTTTVCPGEDVSFGGYVNDNSGVSFHWDFGDGNTSLEKDPVHTFNIAGFFEVRLIAVNNCLGSDTARKWVNVNPDSWPNAELNSLPPSICPGEKVYFFDQVNEMLKTNYQYSVWFGDGDSLVNISQYSDTIIPVIYHVYNDTGNYDFIFTVTNLCGNTDSLTGTILVHNNPSVPAFNYVMTSLSDDGDPSENDTTGCPGDAILFMSLGGISCHWDFGDNTFSTLQNVYHQYSDTGIYQVTLISTNGCGRTDTLKILVRVSTTNTPKSWFDVSDNTFCAGDSVKFKYYPNGINAYNLHWDFGDESTSTELDPVHFYSSGGDYVVKLVVTNGCGSDSSFRTVHIANPEVSFSTPDFLFQVNTAVPFTNHTEGAVSYLWSFGDGTTSTLQNPTHTYTSYGLYAISLTATSVFGCTSIAYDTIYVHDLHVTAVVHDYSCYNFPDGYIDITVTGGYPPYSYEWTHSGYTQPVTTQDLTFSTQIIDGDWTVVITDQNEISVSATYTLNRPQDISFTSVITDAVCGNDGSISITAAGGTPPYMYSWSNGLNDSIVSNLDTGTYTYTITDSHGCTKTNTITIQNPTVPHLSLMTANYPATCHQNNGTAWVFVTGGSGSYYFFWSDSLQQQNDTAYNLVADIYGVLVLDVNTGCTDSAFVLINENGGPVVTQLMTQPVSCHGQANGGASVTATGIAPLTYVWGTTPAGFGQSISGQPGGILIFAVVDTNNCKTFGYVTIPEPEELNLSFTYNNPFCYGSYTGNATANVTGGTQPYQFHWSNGSPYQSLTNRNANTYSVTVTDSHSCIVTGSITLVNPPQIMLTTNIYDVTFYGLENGSIDLTITGGDFPFTYNWSNNDHTQDIEQLAAGNYSVTITDANNCTAQTSAIVSQPDILLPHIQASGPANFCYGDSAALDAGSGYEIYQWSTGETSQSITVFETGYYTVAVMSDSSIGWDSVYINAAHPFSDEQICIVTLDSATGKNMIVWEKTNDAGTTSYNLYKETSSAGQYALLANIPFSNMSLYIDTSSNPSQHSDRYRLAVIDTCGNESEMSSPHKTMHLTVSTGIGVYNLIWENYEGFTFPSYTIYRGSSPDFLLPIGAIQSNLTTYTDYQPIGAYYYQIVVIKGDSCWASGTGKDMSGPFSQSLSNIEDNGIIDNISNGSETTTGLSIWPNPFNTSAIVYFINKNNVPYHLTITDVTGKIVRTQDQIIGNKVVIEKRTMLPGFYTIELKGDKTYRGKIIIE
ncbi:MAG: PKD domain-containing protein [Bacteroidia bacterium]|nr:PKD domain-containing protein [Bacteroidia bacterium]